MSHHWQFFWLSKDSHSYHHCCSNGISFLYGDCYIRSMFMFYYINMEHTMKLRNHAFRMIESGKKNIEIRLYDEKRQKLSIGDTILFINEVWWSMTKKIIWLSIYDSFMTMFSVHQPSCFGGDNIEEIIKRLYKYYSHEKEKYYGVCAITLA